MNKAPQTDPVVSKFIDSVTMYVHNKSDRHSNLLARNFIAFAQQSYPCVVSLKEIERAIMDITVPYGAPRNLIPTTQCEAAMGEVAKCVVTELQDKMKRKVSKLIKKHARVVVEARRNELLTTMNPVQPIPQVQKFLDQLDSLLRTEGPKMDESMLRSFKLHLNAFRALSYTEAWELEDLTRINHRLSNNELLSILNEFVSSKSEEDKTESFTKLEALIKSFNSKKREK